MACATHADFPHQLSSAPSSSVYTVATADDVMRTQPTRNRCCERPSFLRGSLVRLCETDESSGQNATPPVGTKLLNAAPQERAGQRQTVAAPEISPCEIVTHTGAATSRYLICLHEFSYYCNRYCSFLHLLKCFQGDLITVSLSPVLSIRGQQISTNVNSDSKPLSAWSYCPRLGVGGTSIKFLL